MRLIAFLAALVALAACGSYAGSSGLMGWNPGRDHQVMLDTAAILQGMAQAHEEKAQAAACNAATPVRSDRSPCR
jgi:hypothetical protein